ncbi:MAG: TIGR03617 family F420-dependent LLM class oxidoreductase [Actinomycetales bacterium]|nr:TIGR03617 family F420-dependent LLM class oxidoreductase [Actinomycetales bacterium]
MRVDTVLAVPPAGIAEAARRAEAAGFAAGWTVELDHDAFLGAMAAAQATTRLEVGTSISVAFGRSPLTLAQAGWDLQAYSAGRFTLGLGSQVKPHIEKRYSMPWSAPAARMREIVLAVRAIWESWATRGPLEFRGEHYTHTLMTPMFMPDPRDLPGHEGPGHGLPPVLIAAVGPLMAEVAGEVGDGVIAHAFTTARYLDEVTIPRLQAGRRTAGKPAEGGEVSAAVMIATGATDEDLAASTAIVRQRVGFYASTPSYRGVLDVHGWGEVQEGAAEIVRAKDWARLGEVITDEVLDAFAVVARPEELPARLRERYAGRATRVSLAPARAEDAAIIAGAASALAG